MTSVAKRPIAEVDVEAIPRILRRFAYPLIFLAAGCASSGRSGNRSGTVESGTWIRLGDPSGATEV
ncbi:hypothetical protein SAMN06295937_1004161 [Sphingopyxis flava]|uniref:Uncharacterized protein n=1 Tax=Sphingopyxis flava TaxID=1507287 RepID=A0A1T5AT94_9SPHN|nr:hypothetical protein SAMN06295937_1004161 [Sphingopyxis flava]